ncbi:hypothetical protein M432DRAFT_588099 [Thermoascus aurantiacus ATCC 26904]
MSHTAGFSKVGQRSIYESDNQRNVSIDEIKERRRYREGPPGSHMPDDTKDPESISNWLRRKDKDNAPYNPEAELAKMDPTAPAILHGNKPSRGAEIDKELKRDDEQRLREMAGR